MLYTSIFGTPMPIVKIDDSVVFPTGKCRRLNYRERKLFEKGNLFLDMEHPTRSDWPEVWGRPWI